MNVRQRYMSTDTKNKDLHYYLNLPWCYRIEQEKDEQDKLFYVVRVNEFPGVVNEH